VEGEPEGIKKALNRLSGAQQVRHSGGLVYEFESLTDLRPEAASAVISAGGQLFNLEVATQSLDEIYSHYFKEVEHDAAS
jgi:ABC-2 type transport system ATP-binding protein